ncbi:hypothetical protein [uncultured Sphingomonas sp.]|jgi:hypothetical protein|uniref:hypothetical protein n=1 Tax=unclassified Sphingomonas TaxID=196159 RepID=UPI0025E7E742|nr:hypothetical protein [uncultured Sphingomonas sp.]
MKLVHNSPALPQKKIASVYPRVQSRIISSIAALTMTFAILFVVTPPTEAQTSMFPEIAGGCTDDCLLAMTHRHLLYNPGSHFSRTSYYMVS